MKLGIVAIRRRSFARFQSGVCRRLEPFRIVAARDAVAAINHDVPRTRDIMRLGRSAPEPEFATPPARAALRPFIKGIVAGQPIDSRAAHECPNDELRHLLRGWSRVRGAMQWRAI